MKIKLMTLMAGPSGVFLPGTIVDLPDLEARQLILGRYAVPVDPEPTPEAAVLEGPQEKAVKPRPRRR
jgi:hypothetical protein